MREGQFRKQRSYWAIVWLAKGVPFEWVVVWCGVASKKHGGEVRRVLTVRLAKCDPGSKLLPI